MLLENRADSRPKIGIVASEHFDGEIRRKLQQRLVGVAHSQSNESSSRMRAQTPPSRTLVSTISGRLTICSSPNEILTSPTFVPPTSGAASSAATSMLAASFV